MLVPLTKIFVGCNVTRNIKFTSVVKVAKQKFTKTELSDLKVIYLFADKSYNFLASFPCNI